ncbi:hypothetical protein EW146_g9102 [Bondarzewia mesenterica]|uniref:Uncharacterized protein n=1 Tax=Bondarzewia mesenterica TaxID=1095465 RepID=A0A4S4L987_9AGAM|nr:hypothetical protein EW146_g9102 [Bondarzewia mesenterica]
MGEDLIIEMPSNLHPSRASLELSDPYPPRRGGITSLTVDVPSSYRPPYGLKPPSRWRTPEFMLYYIIFILAVPWMIWVPISLSSSASQSNASHRNYNLYRHRLAHGWLFGREVDNSDLQYRSFRSNIPALAALISIFFLLKYIYTRPILRASSTPPSDNLYRLPFYTIFSFIMLFVLHGTSAFKILLILSINYALAKACGQYKCAVIATWVFNSGVLFLNEMNAAYAFASVHPSLQPLDSWQGVYPRWHISFNITMLRLISFSMDYYWASNRTGTPDTSNSEMDAKRRTTTFHTIETYSYRNYLAYALYAPLYIAGPIMTFNDFMWQLARPTTISMGTTARYALRFLVTLLTMECILHFMYVVAIKDAHAWAGDSAAQLSMIGFWNLIVVWLKLLLPWRFFRLWALLDGIDPPENMIRCMANNYSTLGFWRSWHRSYNLWIVRYAPTPSSPLLSSPLLLSAHSEMHGTFVQIYIHPAGRDKACRRVELARVLVRRALA